MSTFCNQIPVTLSEDPLPTSVSVIGTSQELVPSNCMDRIKMFLSYEGVYLKLSEE